jgi:hypothetical protein
VNVNRTKGNNNMKTISIFLSLIIFVCFSQLSFSQLERFKDKQTIINDLDTSDIGVVIDAISIIKDSAWADAEPKIVQNIDRFDYGLRHLFMKTLLKINSPRLDSLAHIIYDSAEVLAYPSSRNHANQIRSYATCFMIMVGDYSTIQALFDNLELTGDDGRSHGEEWEALVQLVKHVPQYATQARTELIRLTSAPKWYGIRWRTMEILVDVYGNEMIPNLITMFQSDTGGSTVNRMFAMNELFKLDYNGIYSLLSEQLFINSDRSTRCLITDSLLSHYGTPSDYKLVKDFSSQETDTLVLHFVKEYLTYYIPRPATSNSTIISMIDTLTTYKGQVVLYDWLGEQSFVNELDSNLISARSYIVVGDSSNCARQIKLFQQKVDEEYRDSLDGDNKFVTVEGWKFLYYNAQYILDRLPIPPPEYNLNTIVIGNGTVTKSPELALYDSSTTVTLTANPSTGYRFISWSGDAVGTVNPISVVMNSDKNIAATFLQNTFIITATAGANGTITPSGDVSVTYGADQSFAITPNSGYHIADVIVDQTSVGAVVTFNFTNVTAPHTISSTFAINTYTLTVNAINGTVTKTPDQPAYNHGTSVQLTATPNTGYRFVSWSRDLTGSVNPVTITMDANKNITANFALNPPTITSFTPANGPIGTSVTVTGTNFVSISSVKFNGTIASYTVNSSTQITATVPTGATTGSITVTNTAGTGTSPTSFIVGYTITIQISGSGTVTKLPNQLGYASGTTVKLTAKATIAEPLKIVPNTPEPTSWKFDHWEIDLTGTQNPKNIIMNGNKTVKAVFIPVY